MNQRPVPSRGDHNELGQALSLLLRTLEAHGEFGMAHAGTADWRARTRRQAEICLSGLQCLLSELGQEQGAAGAGAMPAAPGRTGILVADDNPANLALIEYQLEALGWRADGVPDGAQALERWRQGGYDLLLIDRQMPVMDGLELARAIRLAEGNGGARRAVLIGTTAGNYREEIGPARAAGMDDLLTKPIELNDLARLLARWLPDESTRVYDMAQAGDAAVLDAAYIERIIGPIDAWKRDHLIETFLASTETELLAARRQFRNYSGEMLRRTLHKLKSAARMAGALRFARHAEVVEQMVRSGESAGVEAGLEWLALECDQIRIAARQLLEASPVTDPLRHLAMGAMPGVACIVDADPLAREQLALMLVSHGWGEVRACESGEVALERVEAGNPVDLLVCAIDLQGMNCIEVIRNLHERGFAGGIVLVGGDDDRLLGETVHLMRAMGMPLWGELYKPFSHDDFAALLAGSPRAMHDLAERGRQTISREELLAAIHDGVFQIYYQPIVDTSSLAVVGVEALARWQREGGHVSPKLFIRAAEEHELIAPLSELLLIEALSGAAELAEAGIRLPLSINLSSTWLRSAKVPELIQACATATGVANSDVTFELREDQMLDHPENMKIVLQQLRRRGFQLAVDDLAGSRSAALEEMHHLSLNELKLDHALVSGAEENPAGRALLASCIAMAHRLDVSLVAEGVETDSELALMREMGCDHVQGWLIARAMPVRELIEWLRGRGS